VKNYLLLTLLCLMFGTSSASASITVTDMLQRKVTLPGPAKRIVLGESRHIITLALLEKDPFRSLVGWEMIFNATRPPLGMLLRSSIQRRAMFRCWVP